MEAGFQRPFRIVVAAGWLALAWIHLFWDGEGIYAAASPMLPEGLRPEPGAVAGSRIGLAFGAWFLAGGTLALVWQPAWLARAVLGLGTLPALLAAAARAVETPQPLASGLAESWLWWAPLLLILPADRVAGVRAWGMRIGLGLVVGGVAVSLLASGRFPWETEVEAASGWHGFLPGAMIPWAAAVLGILAVASWVVLWVRPVAAVGVVGLVCVGLCSALAWAQGESVAAEGLAHWHRRAPEMVILLGAAGLPWAALENRSRRRLRRVEAVG